MSDTIKFETRLEEISKYSDILLINCPHNNIQFPPAGIAYLCEAVKNAGYVPRVLDINILLLQKYKTTGLTEHWEESKYEYLWQQEAGYKEMRAIIDRDLQLIAETIASCPAKILGFSVNMMNERCTDDLVTRVKQIAPDKRIIYGGFSYYHETLAKEISDLPEAVAVGDAEETIVKYMDQVSSDGSIHGISGLFVNDRKGKESFIPSSFSTPVDNIAWPRWKEFHLSDYTFLYPQLQMPVHSSRGCAWGRCTFCSASRSNPGYRHRTSESIFEEIKYLYDNYGVTGIFLTTLQVNGNYEQLEKLCDLIIESGIYFTPYGQFTIDKRMNDKFCKKLHQAGFLFISFGMESGSSGTLKKMRKGYNSRIAAQVLTACHNARIITSVNLIAGYPGETEEEFQETLSFIEENQNVIDQVEVVPTLSIHFGSELWSDPEKFEINFEPKPNQWIVNDWISFDGKNTFDRRTEKQKMIFDSVKRLGIGRGYVKQKLNFSEGRTHEFKETSFKGLIASKLDDLFPRDKALHLPRHEHPKVLILQASSDAHLVAFISELHAARPEMVMDMLVQPGAVEFYSSVAGINEIVVCDETNFFSSLEVNQEKLGMLKEKMYDTVIYVLGNLPEGFYRQVKGLALKICHGQVIGVNIQGNMKTYFPQKERLPQASNSMGVLLNSE
ncbi:MAG: radical SAM protein [Desulfobacteraceae bacterium]|nr:radical SAM protein [Desulfobacteraceae bacterium]